ncbi:transporter substrate-binding domain-containing protein [Thiohalocapsa marina]|uniref:Transporter substrate-binding domain-containing protein n=1 Tax=Thiohalocapsa marina TaxID=424902 RepID=A0A5M8FTF6_9GAMM|nr:transporter substrate-binding domain-containing protein [Thiohalocapsa marina]KAA6187059.1 transporter substrate-binding domain-containing protein [Thiohalocapsa marina]
MMPAHRIVVFAHVVIGLALAGPCSAADEGVAQTPAASTAVQAVGAPVLPPVEAASASEQCKSGVRTPADLRIYTEAFPPYNDRAPDGTLIGSSTDVVCTILSRLGQAAPIELVPWAEGYRQTLETPGSVLYSTARIAEREPLFAWVGPVGAYELVFYAKASAPIRVQSLEAVRNAGPIGVVEASARHRFLQRHNITHLTTCPDDVTCVQALMAGDIALWFGSSDTAAENIRKAGIEQTDIVALYPVETRELFIAFNKQTDPARVAAWQGALDAMKADGTYDAIMARHFGEQPVRDDTDPLLSSLVALTELRLGAIARTFQVLALTEEVQSGVWERIRPLLVEQERGEAAARLWYARPDGSYYTTVDDLTSGNLMARPYFPGLLAGVPAVGPVVVSLSTGRTTAIVAVPVMDGKRVTGVLGASVYAEVLSREISRMLSLPEDRTFFALDSRGKYILHAKAPRIGQDPAVQVTPAARDIFRRMMQQPQGQVGLSLAGRDQVLSFRKSTLTGWRFAVITKLRKR